MNRLHGFANTHRLSRFCSPVLGTPRFVSRKLSGSLNGRDVWAVWAVLGLVWWVGGMAKLGLVFENEAVAWRVENWCLSMVDGVWVWT